jgi:4-hydroxy-4-methyl-2-oxoglutarate aldolase
VLSERSGHRKRHGLCVLAAVIASAMTQPASDPYVIRLRNLDACAVSDALDSLKLTGQLVSLPRRSGKGRIAGRVTTLKVGTGALPPGPPRHLGTMAIESSGPDHVIVVEQRSGINAGCWGGLLTLGAQARGIAGLVADGPVRDIDEARDLQFPIFAAQTTCLTARGRVVENGTNIDIEICEVRVSAGDFVVADDSAIIFIRQGDIEAVLSAAEHIVAREADMARAIRAGVPISQVLSGHYEHMLIEKT